MIKEKFLRMKYIGSGWIVKMHRRKKARLRFSLKEGGGANFKI